MFDKLLLRPDRKLEDEYQSNFSNCLEQINIYYDLNQCGANILKNNEKNPNAMTGTFIAPQNRLNLIYKKILFKSFPLLTTLQLCENTPQNHS